MIPLLAIVADTGKTSTVAPLLVGLVDATPTRVLACAPTNAAITEVATRVVKLVRKNQRLSDEAVVMTVDQLASWEPQGSSAALEPSSTVSRKLHLSDMVLVASKRPPQRPANQTSEELSCINLAARVDRLLDALGPMGWTQVVEGLRGWSERAPEQYIKAQPDQEGEQRTGHRSTNAPGSLSFGVFIKDALQVHMQRLLIVGTTLLGDAPRSVFKDHAHAVQVWHKASPKYMLMN